MISVLLLAATPGQAPRVSARLSTTTAAVGETVTLDVIIEDASDDVDIAQPRIPSGLDLVGTQDYTEMQYSIPGGRHLTRRREFVIQASMPGRFRIPPVIVTVGRKAYRSNALEILVTGTAQSRTFESSDDAWLHATMRPETVYVGQQSTLTVEAGFSEDVRTRLTRPPVFDTPSPTGFWVQDVPGGVSSRLRSVNGRITEIQSLQRAYFPLSSGKYALAPARAIVDVREGFLFAPESRELRSPSPRLVVLPLPERAQPRDFKGAVGSFSIRARVEPDTVAAGEAAQVSVEVTGTGNIKAAPVPNVPTVAGVEQFTPTEEARIAFDGAIVRGTKLFQWVIIPQRSGRIEIPPISYVYFDPAAKTYKRISTAPLTLIATTGAEGADSAAVGTALRALRPAPHYTSLTWVRRHWFAWLQLLPLLAIAAAAAGQRTRRRGSRQSAFVEEMNRIAEGRAPFPQFLRDLEGVVRNAAVLRTGNTRLRTAEVRALDADLAAHGVSDAVRARVVACIERIETQRFAPTADEAAERDALLRDARAVVALIAEKPAAGSAHASVALIALALLQATPATTFQRGVELYRNGQFAQAAATFDEVVRTQPNDVAAWANLGNAYFRAGDRGHAVWAWARAARAAPRDGAIVANLQSVGAVEVLRTRPPLSVRPVEWYLLAALCWWLCAALIIAEIVRKRRALLAWALALALCGGIALTVGSVADHQRYAVALDDETPLYGDPTIHSPVVRKVQSGAGLDVLETRTDWLRVRTLTQAEGWVEADAAGML
ncbi:MAG TPA: BatD family protein [Longimicrobiales bacterium]